MEMLLLFTLSLTTLCGFFMSLSATKKPHPSTWDRREKLGFVLMISSGLAGSMMLCMER